VAAIVVHRAQSLTPSVRADPEFSDTPKVINGFSDLFVEVFGESGRGSCSVVAMVTLPFQIAVEVEVVLE
jgi:hypothetical protein